MFQADLFPYLHISIRQCQPGYTVAREVWCLGAEFSQTLTATCRRLGFERGEDRPPCADNRSQVIGIHSELRKAPPRLPSFVAPHLRRRRARPAEGSEGERQCKIPFRPDHAESEIQSYILMENWSDVRIRSPNPNIFAFHPEEKL